MDRSFDAVLFCLTLEHLSDLSTLLCEARKILADRGRIYIFEIHPFLSLSGPRSNACREWRPRDLGTPEPLQNLDRGPDFPMLVEFTLTSRR